MALPGSPVTDKILDGYLLDDLRELNRIAGERAEVLAMDRPEDCERECWKRGGSESCLCEEGDDGTWQPGC